MSNSLGKVFRITSIGESHGAMVGSVINGCPAGLALSTADVQIELDRRKPGTSPISTPRQEEDRVVILSGILNGRTTSAPICLAIWNENADSTQYEKMKDTPRPGHADYTAYVKYGSWADLRGGGRFSGRITAGFVMAGAVARKLLATLGIEILAHTTDIGNIRAESLDIALIKDQVNQNPVHCADPQAARKMIQAIQVAQNVGDSLGGIIEVIAMGIPAGWGEPIFDNMDGDLAKAFFAIPAVKGVEFGAGFNAAYLKGSQNNDPYVIHDGKIVTTTNNAGGILGGITSGMPLVARLAFKPTPSIKQPQQTVNLKDMSETSIRIEGRHDGCIVPRAVVVAEAMTCIVLCDMALRAGALPGVIK